MAAPRPATLHERTSAALQRIWERRGGASAALLPFSWLFGAVAAARRELFARGMREPARLPVPVIVVGNLVVGGAGKTPAVIAIVEILRRSGRSPGIVSRGYGRSNDDVLVIGADADAGQVGDEPLLMQRRTGVPVAVGADRAAAGHALLHAYPGVDVIVSDDGLQHLGLDRDVEVIVFDERGAGNGRLLPAGPLRERVPNSLGPRQIVLYNAEVASTSLPGHTARRSLAGVSPLDAWWAGAEPSREALEALRGREVVAVAGLARPDRFFAMLRDLGLHLVECAPGDHADFAALPWPPGAGDIVLTEKDAVKLPPTRSFGARVWVARLDFAPEPAFGAALLALLALPTLTASHGNSPA